MTIKVKDKRKKRLQEGDRDHPMGVAETTIFSSRDSMTSEERTAVKTGAARGKRVSMSERPEHYGCIGSVDSIRYGKNSSLLYDCCVKCENFTGKPEHEGQHCSLEEWEKCIE